MACAVETDGQKGWMNSANREQPLLIVQIESPQQDNCGDYYYRTYTPGLAMSQLSGTHVVTLTNIHRHKDEIASKADVLILKNICDPDFLPVIEKRRKRGQLTVYEMADDLAAVEPWNPVYFFYSNGENLQLVYRLASYCDGLQFSVPRLR